MTDRQIRLIPSEHPPDLPGPGAWYAVEVDGSEVAEAHFAADDADRWVVDRLVVRAARISSDDLRAIPIGELERHLNVGFVRRDGELVEGEPLRRWKGESAPDFYERVARTYGRYMRVSRSPAAEIAKASGVPVRTVHGWIREARKIGALPPGRQGAAG